MSSSSAAPEPRRAYEREPVDAYVAQLLRRKNLLCQQLSQKQSESLTGTSEPAGADYVFNSVVSHAEAAVVRTVLDARAEAARLMSVAEQEHAEIRSTTEEEARYRVEAATMAARREVAAALRGCERMILAARAEADVILRHGQDEARTFAAAAQATSEPDEMVFTHAGRGFGGRTERLPHPEDELVALRRQLHAALGDAPRPPSPQPSAPATLADGPQVVPPRLASDGQGSMMWAPPDPSARVEERTDVERLAEAPWPTSLGPHRRER